MHNNSLCRMESGASSPQHFSGSLLTGFSGTPPPIYLGIADTKNDADLIFTVPHAICLGERRRPIPSYLMRESPTSAVRKHRTQTDFLAALVVNFNVKGG